MGKRSHWARKGAIAQETSCQEVEKSKTKNPNSQAVRVRFYLLKCRLTGCDRLNRYK